MSFTNMADFSIFCNNSGNDGHLFYQCKKPITSIGIIVFTKQKTTCLRTPGIIYRGNDRRFNHLLFR